MTLVFKSFLLSRLFVLTDFSTKAKMADTMDLPLLSQPESHGEGSQSMTESTGEGNTEPRLMISKIVCENFKSYAGVKELGPFHKVHFALRHR